MALPIKRTAYQAPSAPRKKRRFNSHAQNRENLHPGVRRCLGFRQEAGKREGQQSSRWLPHHSVKFLRDFEDMLQVDPKKADQVAAGNSQRFLDLAVKAHQENPKPDNEVEGPKHLRSGVNFFVMPQQDHNAEASQDDCPMDVSPGK